MFNNTIHNLLGFPAMIGFLVLFFSPFCSAIWLFTLLFRKDGSEKARMVFFLLGPCGAVFSLLFYFVFSPAGFNKDFNKIKNELIDIPFAGSYEAPKAPQQPKPPKTEFVNKFNSSPMFKD